MFPSSPSLCTDYNNHTRIYYDCQSSSPRGTPRLDNFNSSDLYSLLINSGIVNYNYQLNSNCNSSINSNANNNCNITIKATSPKNIDDICYKSNVERIKLIVSKILTLPIMTKNELQEYETMIVKGSGTASSGVIRQSISAAWKSNPDLKLCLIPKFGNELYSSLILIPSTDASKLEELSSNLQFLNIRNNLLEELRKHQNEVECYVKTVNEHATGI